MSTKAVLEERSFFIKDPYSLRFGRPLDSLPQRSIDAQGNCLETPAFTQGGQVNCEVEKELARKYRVHELPGHILFQNGKEMGRTSGEKNREEIETWLDQNSSMEIVV